MDATKYIFAVFAFTVIYGQILDGTLWVSKFILKYYVMPKIIIGLWQLRPTIGSFDFSIYS